MTTNTETKVAVELTKEEMQVIEANRKRNAEAKEAKRVEDERKAKVEFEQGSRLLKERQAFEAIAEKKFAAIPGWVMELITGESMVFEFEGGVHVVPSICMCWTNSKFAGVRVTARMHRVYSGTWSRYGTSKGFKLFVAGDNYSLTDGMENRAYANPKSINDKLVEKVAEIEYAANLKAEKAKTAQTKESFLSEVFGIKVVAGKEWVNSFRHRYEVDVYEAEVSGRTIRFNVEGISTNAGIKSDPHDFTVAGIGSLTRKAAFQIFEAIKNCPVNSKGNR